MSVCSLYLVTKVVEILFYLVKDKEEPKLQSRHWSGSNICVLYKSSSSGKTTHLILTREFSNSLWLKLAAFFNMTIDVLVLGNIWSTVGVTRSCPG